MQGLRPMMRPLYDVIRGSVEDGVPGSFVGASGRCACPRGPRRPQEPRRPDRPDLPLIGSARYRINERKEQGAPRLTLRFDDASELNFYTCSVRFVEGTLDAAYDWSGDVMSTRLEPGRGAKQAACAARYAGLRRAARPERFRRRRQHHQERGAVPHPRAPAVHRGALPARKLAELVEQARVYSFEFLEWKRAFVLRQHWLAHTKRTCPRCDIPFTKAHIGRDAPPQLLLRALPAALLNACRGSAPTAPATARARPRCRRPPRPLPGRGGR